MKRVLPIFTFIALLAVVMTACNKNPKAGIAEKTLSYEDTVGLSQFQAWKMQNELLNANQYQQAAVKAPATAPRKTVRRSTPSYGSGSMKSGSENYAKTEKKGWSKAAKGAAIGGGAGAVAGAVLVKNNRVAGGVVGGVVGAGIGYLIGRSKDKKDGRY
jgi:hypothetical protein